VLPDAASTQSGVELVVTDRPADVRSGDATIVAVSLPALARSFAGPLPARAIDAASAVMTYGDVIGWVPAPDPASTALVGPGPDVSHATLFGWATGNSDVPDGARAMVSTDASAQRADATARLLRHTLDVLRTAGSVVVLDAATTTALLTDPSRRARLLDSERITAWTWSMPD